MRKQRLPCLRAAKILLSNPSQCNESKCSEKVAKIMSSTCDGGRLQVTLAFSDFLGLPSFQGIRTSENCALMRLLTPACSAGKKPIVQTVQAGWFLPFKQ